MRLRRAALILAQALSVAWALAGPARGAAPAWTRLEMPHFTVISAAPADATLNWAIEFEQFHRGLGQVLTLNDALLRPVTVVLFADQSDLRPYKPLEKGRPARVDGYFTRTAFGNYIAVASNHLRTATRMLIFHEETHWLTHAADLETPLWLDEGLAEVFSTFALDENGGTYTTGIQQLAQVGHLRQRPLMPLKQLLQVQRGSLLYNEGDRTGIFYAESWAFVHYLLFSDHARLRSQYTQLIHLLRPGADLDAVFRQTFGVDCAAMDRRLESYLTHGQFVMLKIPFDRGAIVRAARTRPATPAEVDLAESALLLSLNRWDEALPRVRRAAAALPRNSSASDLLAAAEFAAGHYAAALSAARKAAALGSTDPAVYCSLGDAALGLLTDSGPATARGGPPQARAALDFYHRAVTLDQGNRYAYDQMARYLNLLDSPTFQDSLDLKFGAFFFPNDAVIKIGLELYSIKLGQIGATGGQPPGPASVLPVAQPD